MDPVTICNAALGMLGDVSGSKRMTTMDRAKVTQPSHHVILDFYDTAQEEMLAAIEWQRAQKIVTMTVSADDPVLSGLWTYKYVRPPDAVIIRALCDTSGKEYKFQDMAEERIAGGQKFDDEYIYCNEEDMLCRYTYRLSEARYMPGMAPLHAAYLAEQAAMSVLGNEGKAMLITKRLELRIERLCKAWGGKEKYIENEKGKWGMTSVY